VSIKGRPYAWFRSAIDRGDLAGIRAAAAEMPVVDLTDALQILPVIAAKEPGNFERAACRWLARLALERDVGLEEIGVALAALDQIPEQPAAAQILRRLLA
jgi:hypothetical protein